MQEFWSLTPRETAMVFDAALWRQEQEARRDLTVAWYAAALSRAKRMPTLKDLLNPGKTRQLTPEEREKRASEHAELIARMGAKHGQQRNKTRNRGNPGPSATG